MEYGFAAFFLAYILSLLIEVLSGIPIPDGYHMGFSVFAGAITAIIYYITKSDRK